LQSVNIFRLRIYCPFEYITVITQCAFLYFFHFVKEQSS
jgi:hypothetical protein